MMAALNIFAEPDVDHIFGEILNGIQLHGDIAAVLLILGMKREYQWGAEFLGFSRGGFAQQNGVVRMKRYQPAYG